MLQLSRTTALRLTTARYYTPSGRSVQEGGIEPDIRVPQLSDADYESRPEFREADLRRHLINEAKVEDDGARRTTARPIRASPRPPSELEKKGIKDFQLDYALKTHQAARPAAPRAARRSKPPVAKLDRSDWAVTS